MVFDLVDLVLRLRVAFKTTIGSINTFVATNSRNICPNFNSNNCVHGVVFDERRVVLCVDYSIQCV